METKQKEIKTIDKEIYKKLVSEIEIKEILLKNLELGDVSFPDNGETDGKAKVDYGCDNNDLYIEKDKIEFHPKFLVEIKIGEKTCVLIKFKMRVIYDLKNASSFDKDYLLFFMEKNLPVNVWPYAREIISSITTRIGFTPFILSPYRRS